MRPTSPTVKRPALVPARLPGCPALSISPLASLAAAVALCAPGAFAWQTPAAPSSPAAASPTPASSPAASPAPGRRTARARRIEPAQAPVIDGRLDDPVWSLAEPIGELVQVVPVEGAAPSESTSVRVAFTTADLFLAILCRDRDPQGIVATQMKRDARLDPDDRVEIVFDTFHDRRNAFFFQIGAAGSRGDALIGNDGSTFTKPWDAIWEARTCITQEGWCAELRIPFQSIAFDPSLDRWGFNVARRIKRREEEDRWTAARQTLGLFRISEAGDLTGLGGMRQGRGIDVRPYAKGIWDRDRDRAGEPHWGFDPEAGFDLLYRILPSLTATFTANPDFAETEVDERQVNLTRFPLFFPEKRDFFLQDAAIFAFADPGRRRALVLPFFSRRIGLTGSGSIVPLYGGVKLSGRAGPWNLGVLDVQTEPFDDASAGIDLPSKNLFVGRASYNLSDDLAAGGILTRGNPDGPGSNTMGGADVVMRRTDFLGDKNLNLSASMLLSTTSTAAERDRGARGDGMTWSVNAAYPNDIWRADATFEDVGGGFFPALGFTQRTGVRHYRGQVSWNPRPGTWIRQERYGIFGEMFTDLQGHAQTAQVSLTPYRVELESGDILETFVSPQLERIEENFEIVPGLVVPPERYRFVQGGGILRTSSKRPVSIEVQSRYGSFFEGTQRFASGRVSWRPSRHWTFSGEWEETRFRLDFGEATVRLARLRGEWSWSPDLLTAVFLQWDNVTDEASLNARLRFIHEDGRELFLVLNQGWRQERDGSIAATRTDVTLKILWTVRV